MAADIDMENTNNLPGQSTDVDKNDQTPANAGPQGETELVVAPSDTTVAQRPPLNSQGSMLYRATQEVSISEAQRHLFAVVLGSYWILLLILYFATSTFDKLVVEATSGIDENAYVFFSQVCIMIFIG